MSNTNLPKRDYNFFSAAIGPGRSSRKRLFLHIAFFLILVMLAAGAYYRFESVIRTGKAQIAAYNVFLESEETTGKRQQVMRKKQEIENLKKYAASLDTFHLQLRSMDTIGTEYIRLITSAIPEGLFFESISMTASQLQIEGNATTRVQIAELLHNMEELGIFQDVHISTVKPAEGETAAFTFSMSCKRKEAIGK
jgi:type IV pilus assembly protein PilN